MVAIATLVSLIIGLPIGVLLVISEPKGVKPNKNDCIKFWMYCL